MVEDYQTMFDKAFDDLKKYLAPGAFAWLEKVHPGYNARVTVAENAVNAAWKQPDKKKFRDALAGWYSLVRRGMEEFRLSGLIS